MAGKKQHYIPRLLLRGFKIPGQRAELVTLYRIDVPQRQVSIDDICNGKYFYSGAADPTLDEKITSEESAVFGPAISSVRAGALLSREIEDALRRFFVHLMLRTETTRTALDEIVSGATNGFVDSISDPHVVARMMTTGSVDLRKSLKKALDDRLAERGKTLDRNTRRRIQKLGKSQMESRISEAAEFVATTARAIVPSAISDANVSGESIQKGALIKDVAPRKRVANLDRLKMSIVEFRDVEHLILGDDPIVAFAGDGKPLRAFTSFSQPQVYVLPVAPTRAVVLHDSQLSDLPSSATINDASAVLSRTQFIARVPTPRFAALRDLIGSHHDPYRDVDWKRVISGEPSALDRSSL